MRLEADLHFCDTSDDTASGACSGYAPGLPRAIEAAVEHGTMGSAVHRPLATIELATARQSG